MREQICEVLSKVLRVEAHVLTDASSPDSIPSWDSLSHLQLVAALERHFSVRFNLREIQSMDSFGRIEAILRVKAESGVPS